MNAIRGKMKELMRNENQRLKGISPHTMVDFFGESAIQKLWLASLLNLSYRNQIL
jgi:hypothetical protein